MLKELSLHILDVANNSLSAGAKNLKINVDYQTAKNLLTVEVIDDGKGMDEEFAKKVTDPFVTTRTTRPVGLGLPFFRQAAEMSGGKLEINSRRGKGTAVRATFLIDSIDRMPMGDLPATVTALINANPSVRYVLGYRVDEREFLFDTDNVRSILGEVSISDAEVVAFLKDYIFQGINITNGGSKVL